MIIHKIIGDHIKSTSPRLNIKQFEIETPSAILSPAGIVVRQGKHDEMMKIMESLSFLLGILSDSLEIIYAR